MIPNRQHVIDKFVVKIESEDRRAANVPANGHRASSPRLNNETILKKLRNNSNAEIREDFEDLWAGRWDLWAGRQKDGKVRTQSEADRALCRLFGYYTQDEEQICRLFNRSGLYRFEKWGKRPDYRKRTIKDALKSLKRFYQEPKEDTPKLHHGHSPLRGRDDDEASGGPPLELKTFATIPDPGEREFLIEKFLPKGYTLLFYGDGGTTKSLLVLSMLQAIARGAKYWLGLPVGEKRACAYVDFELDEAEQRRRAFEIAAGDGLSAPPDNLHYLCAAGHPTREVLAYVLRACEEHDIGVVAIDSVGLALEGDPGSSRDVISFFKALDQFRMRGITLILVDHQAKLQSGESYQSKLQYGNAYKGNLSRSRVQVELKKKGEGVRKLVLRQNKANFSDFAEPFGAKVTFEVGRICVQREELDAEDLSEERVLNTSDRVLLALHDGPRYPEDFYSPSVWGVEMPTVKNNISKLRKDGLVKDTGNKEGQSREIELTDAGRRYVQEYLERPRIKLQHVHSAYSALQ